MKKCSYNLVTAVAMAAVCLFVTFVAFGFGQASAATASGADTFKAKCAACHGPDGSGSTPMGQKLKVRDLRSPDVQKQTDDELAAIITNGKPPMPPYGKSLSAGDIQQIVAYLRTISPKS